MCDILIVAEPGRAPWIAKNSDREPGEAQAVEWIAGEARGDGRRRCTHVEVAVPARRHAIVIARPVWMWGAEMGVNARGVAIANEAVFTRAPLPATGLTGMDILRLALEQADDALHAVAILEEHAGAQGGRMGHRHRGFRYHSSFAVADGTEAWVVETAGAAWAARRIEGTASLSNCLSIRADADEARWVDADGSGPGPGAARDFARRYARRGMEVLSGGHRRRAASLAALRATGAPVGPEALAAALSSHAGASPAAGWRMQMPCAHASWWPTRSAGQTTGSMIARAGGAPRVWMTGTSAPCVGVFKPVSVEADVLAAEPPVPERADGESLWWRAERLHRLVLEDPARCSAAIAAQRAALQRPAWDAVSPAEMAACWAAHRAAIAPMLRAAAAARQPRPGPFRTFWRRQSRADGLTPDPCPHTGVPTS